MSITSLDGQKFNRLTVIRLLETRRYGGYRDWLCRCDCGNETHVTTKSLVSGRTKSCGCYQREVNSIAKTLPTTERRFREVLRSYKKTCKEKNREFSLSEVEFRNIVTLPCNYCGHPASDRLNGIDRVDSSIGYRLDNVVPCCRRCNIAKGDMAIGEFREWVGKTYRYMKTLTESML